MHHGIPRDHRGRSITRPRGKRASPTSRSPTATTPSLLSPAERGEGGCGGRAIHAGGGCPPWGGMRQEQRLPAKDAEGRDRDPPAEPGKAGIISGPGQRPAGGYRRVPTCAGTWPGEEKPRPGLGVREGPWCSRGALSLYSLPTELPRCPGTGQIHFTCKSGFCRREPRSILGRGEERPPRAVSPCPLLQGEGLNAERPCSPQAKGQQTADAGVEGGLPGHGKDPRPGPEGAAAGFAPGTPPCPARGQPAPLPPVSQGNLLLF